VNDTTLAASSNSNALVRSSSAAKLSTDVGDIFGDGVYGGEIEIRKLRIEESTIDPPDVSETQHFRIQTAGGSV